MRELAEQDADELVPRPRFPVYGLVIPEIVPIGAMDPGQLDDEWIAVALTYGHWASAPGPWVIVLSRPPEQVPFPKEELLHVIDTDRNRLARDAWVDDEEPVGPPEYLAGRVWAKGRNEHALICRHGTLSAAHLRPGDANVTVLARGLNLAALRLAPVADLAPYWRGREEMLDEMDEYEQRLEPVLEPAEGIAAYRAFTKAEVDALLRIWSASQAGAVPRFRAGEDATTAALWRRSVHELSERSGISLTTAEERVNAFANHLTALVQYARWFGEDERLRDRAADETVRHAMLGEKVSSDKAQQAWAGYWDYQTSVVVQGAEPNLQSVARVGSDLLRQKWIDAWAEWSCTH
jgi:hypothetical protein